jgi:nitrogen-specific signal transduction histidine kinase
MSQPARPLRAADPAPAIDLGAILNSLPNPVLAVTRDREVRFVNAAAEQFFAAAAGYLQARPLHLLVAPGPTVRCSVSSIRRSATGAAWPSTMWSSIPRAPGAAR